MPPIGSRVHNPLSNLNDRNPGPGNIANAKNGNQAYHLVFLDIIFYFVSRVRYSMALIFWQNSNSFALRETYY